MKIAHVCRMGWPHVGGLEAEVRGLAEGLATRGHTVSVITLDRPAAGGARFPEGRFAGVDWVRLRRAGPAKWPLALGLRQAVANADVVHVHAIDGLLDQLLMPPRGAPIGVSTHGGYLHTSRSVAKRLWMRIHTGPQLRRADAVWFTSGQDAATFGRFGVRGQVMPDGVDFSALSRLPRAPQAGPWLVIGRIDVHKGIDDLIDTLSALNRMVKTPFSVDCVGPESVPGLVDRLKSQARAQGVLDKIRFIGAVSDEELRRRLSETALTLFPSRYEGFGKAVVEAMAAGAPVAVSNIPAHRELVRNGSEGAIIDFRQPQLAAKQLLALVPGLPSVQGRERAADFRWELTLPRWEQAYNALVRA